MKRMGQLAGVALVGALALTACGSDNNTGTTNAGSTSSASSDCPTGTLNAEGSSAQKNAIDEAIASFGSTCPDVTVNYNPTGSGSGIKQFIAGQVDFAGSDSSLKTEPKDGKVESDEAAKRCQGNPAWNLPMVTGPIAVAYKLKGVDKLVLTPEVAAKIFLGQITELGRRGHRQDQPWRDAAEGGHQALLPLRRVGHHGELHQVAVRQRPQGLDRRPRQVLDRQG